MNNICGDDVSSIIKNMNISFANELPTFYIGFQILIVLFFCVLLCVNDIANCKLLGCWKIAFVLRVVASSNRQ